MEDGLSETGAWDEKNKLENGYNTGPLSSAFAVCCGFSSNSGNQANDKMLLKKQSRAGGEGQNILPELNITLKTLKITSVF